MFSMPWFLAPSSGGAFSICVPRRLKNRSLLLARRASFWILMLTACVAASAQPALQTLSHNVRQEVVSHKAAFVNALPADQQLHLSIVLPLRNQAQLTALLSRLYDPSSPDYRKFLTVDQFAAQFGATASDYQSVVAFAQANGLTVTGNHANRLVVPVEGSVAQINQVFNVTMGSYQHPTENRTFFSPDREPSLALSTPIGHIEGMNNFSLPHPMLVPGQNTAPLANVTGSGPAGSYLSSDMRAAYYGGTTLTGTGQTVGILEFDGYYLSDVNLTFSNAGQSYTVPINNVLLDGATGAPSGDDGEQVLDIVQAIGMAPGLSQVRVYVGNGLDDADILSSMASENIAAQLSCSWSWTPDDPTTDDVFFQEFAAQGQSFFVASGDYGAYNAGISPYFYPQEDSYVTAVGGTHLETSSAGGAWQSETAWNSLEPGTPYSFGSGGGVSPDSIAIPSWQNGVSTASNGGSATLRNVPDVAMEGDFDNYLCSMGSCFGDSAGTSFAAPRWAGFMALVNQQAVEAGNAPAGGLGFVNPAIYSIGAGANYGSDFHDITTGNNDTEGQPTSFNAVAGYDLVTGWGSANGQALIDALAGPQTPGFWMAASSANISLTPGSSGTTTIAITDAGGFSGNVTLAVTSTLPSGVTASWGTNPTSGTSVLTLTASSGAAASTTTLTITGTSGSLTQTTNITVGVHAPTFTLFASPSYVNLGQGTSSASTITMTPQYGFTGSANLSVSGLPSGVTASWGTNPTSGSSVLTLNASSNATTGPATLTITGTSGNLTVTTTLSLMVSAPSFTLYGYGFVNIGQGTSSSTAIYISALYGFSGNVNFSVSGLPTGVTASFSPTSSNSSTTLTLTASPSASLGTANLTVTGTSGSLTSTMTVILGVFTPTFTLSSPGSVSIGQGLTAQSYVAIFGQYGFSGNVTLSLSGLPSGVTAVWSPNPTSTSSQLTLAASSSAKAGQYALTITGKSGAQTETSALALTVGAPSFTLSTGSATVGQGSSNSTFVDVNDQYGFSGSVNLSVSGLPSGVTGTFSPNPTTYGSNLSMSVASNVAAGQYSFTVTGTSGTQTATTTGTLTVVTPTFTISTYNLVSIGQGTSTTSYVSVYSQNGFNGNVTFSVSGLPAGVTASFSPNPTTNSSTLTLTASGTATVGQYPLTITGTSSTQSATASVTLGVYAPTFSIYSPYSVAIGQGTSTTTSVFVNDQYGFAGNVTLSASGLPAGVTAAFSPNPTTGTSTLTLTASGSANVGQSTITITGTSGSLTQTTTFPLGVYTPTFSLSAGSLGIAQGSSGTVYVNVLEQYGFTGSVNLAVSGLPSGVTGLFSTNPTTNNSVLTLTASSTTPAGQYSLTLTGTSGGVTQTTTIPLSIYGPSFSLYVSAGTFSLNPGASGTFSINVNPQYGFTGSVSFSASGLPNGVTASFSPSSSTTSSTLTLTASASATPGTQLITVTGVSGGLTETTTFDLTVNTPGFALAAAPGTINLVPGGAGKSTVIVTPSNAFDGNVTLSATGLPSGVTATFSANPITPGSSILTLTASSTASAGSAPVTITGTSGSLSSSAPLTVSVGSSTAPPASTATTIAITSSGSPVTSVASGALVTLTAQAMNGSTPLTTGQVNFCDAAAPSCDALHRVGIAQLTSSGTATFSLIPGPGAHNYQAAFVGTSGVAPSSSEPSSLAVTSSIATTTTIAQSGSAGNYTLTSTVTGKGWPAPSGAVSFLDTTNDNALLGSAALSASKSSLSLQAGLPAPSVGANPGAIAMGDFNGDGVPDLAIVNQNSATLTILLGNGNGTFTAASSSPQLSVPANFVVAGDFNRDGKLDLAVSSNNYSSSSLTILLGNGDGTFTTASSPITGPGPTAIAVGDFNGDGIEDLAVASGSSNSLTILIGNGDGTFTASNLSPQAGSNPGSIVCADFNGDGVLDLAVVNSYGGMVTILLGNGDGSFTPAANLSVGASTSATAIAAADFNGDGAIDLAVTTQSSSIVILLGNGDGTFTADAASPQTGNNPVAIVAVDLNGDGNPDLAVVNEYSNSLTVLLGNGDGTFTSFGNITTGSYPAFIAAGDLNGDGSPDLVVTNTLYNTATVLTSQLTRISTATAAGISPIGQGLHTVDASYPGDDAYKSSTSSTIQLTAALGAPNVIVTPESSSVTSLQSLSVNVAVSEPAGDPTPTGSVTLTSGAYSSAPTVLSAGVASFTIPAGSLLVGTDTLKAVYTPDAAGSANYLTATGSAPVAVTAPTGAAPPMVTVTPAAATITNLESDVVTVTVAGASGQATPTGYVALSSGSYSAQQALSGGSASFTIAAGTLSAGANTLTAAYSGDGTYAAAQGTAGITVSQVAMAVPAPAPVTPGSAATATATLSAGSNYSGTMNLTCALTGSPSGAQSLPTCALSPTSLTLSAGGSGTTKLTVNTTAASTASFAIPRRSTFWGFGSGGSALALVVMLGLSRRRRRWLSMLAVVMLIVAAGMIGCGGGGGGSGSNSGGSTTPGTTAGNYTFTVTGTDAANPSISTSASVAISVQ